MLIDSFFSNDKGVDREKISNAIRNGNISEEDFELLISKLREKNYFRDCNFQKNEDKTFWTIDYANKLNLDSLLYFSEEYLRHLREVSSHVNKNSSLVNKVLNKLSNEILKKLPNPKLVLGGVGGMIILVIILVLFSKK